MVFASTAGFSVADQSAVAASINWVAQLLTGPFATTIAVFSIAALGLMMMQGRLDWRQGARVVLGCFILFDAPQIAKGIMSQVHPEVGIRLNVTSPSHLELRIPSPNSTRPDPFAGAALPRRGS